MRRASTLVLVALVPLALVLALAVGAVRIPVDHWLAVILGGGSPLEHDLVWGLRAPRVLAGFVAGGLLALAGVLMQALLRNPLADPWLLGISGGASVGALAALLWQSTLPPAAAALAGAMVCLAAVLALGSHRLAFDPQRVTLAGIAIAAAAGALASLILALAPPGEVHGMLFWLMGDLSGAEAGLLAPAALLLALALAFMHARQLDLLALGDAKATTLGVAVRPLQWRMAGCAALASATAVLLAGNLGFVGLAVPHLLRLAGHQRHRALLPLSVLAGGVLVTLADALARTLAAPTELPTGALLALIGVPVLVTLTIGSRT